MIADCHNDLLLELSYREFQLGEENPFREHWLAPLRAGQVGLQVCALSAQSELTPDGALREVLSQAVAFEHAVSANAGEVMAVNSRQDLAEVAAGKQLGLMLSMEGAEALGRDPWQLDAWWRLGVRMVSLTWEYRNSFADGTGEPEPGAGLSRIGRLLVDRLAERGFMIDLAHASERTFWDVLARAPEANVLVSHAACRAVQDMPRNLSDEQLRALVERDGVFCLMVLPWATGGAGTVGRVLEHLEHAVEVAGIEHVGLGGDFIAQVGKVLARPAPLDGVLGFASDDWEEGDLAGPQDYPKLVQALAERGYQRERLQAILSDNLTRLLRRALPR